MEKEGRRREDGEGRREEGEEGGRREGKKEREEGGIGEREEELSFYLFMTAHIDNKIYDSQKPTVPKCEDLL